MLQNSDLDILCAALEIPAHMTVGAAIETLVGRGASLAVVVDSDSWEVQGEVVQLLHSVDCCLGLVQLSSMVLWSLGQTSRPAVNEGSGSQPDGLVTPVTELPADAVTPDGIDVPLLLAWRWTGEGRGSYDSNVGHQLVGRTGRQLLEAHGVLFGSSCRQ